jgi:transglutaminase-like putative cysteine protease
LAVLVIPVASDEVDDLILDLKDEDWAVRASAARSLGDIGNPRAVDALNGALKDDDQHVQLDAAWALSMIVEDAPLIDDAIDDTQILSCHSLKAAGISHTWNYAGIYEEIDQHALHVPNESETSLERLAQYLSEPAKDEEDKARAIYRWIVANIEYDTDLFAKVIDGAPQQPRTPEEVLRDRKAICSEYSALFKELALLSGIDCVVIKGYAKGYGYAVGSNFSATIKHSWNAIRIEDEWYLVDSTFGAGNIDIGEGSTSKIEDFYFLTPPEMFVWNHFPKDSSCQLLATPISKEEFENSPYLRPPFFKNELGIISHPEGVIRTEGGLTVELSVPSDVKIVAYLIDEGGQKLPKGWTSVKRQENLVQILTAIPGPGNYTLRIYSGRGRDIEQLDWTLDYEVLAGPNTEVEKAFPVISDAFSEYALDIASHDHSPIESTGIVNVTLSVPEAVLVMFALLDGAGIKLPGGQTFAQREGDVYEIRAALPKPGNYTLRIYAKRIGDLGAYTLAIEYEIVARGEIVSDAKFPKTYGRFIEAGARLYRPFEGELMSNNPYLIELWVPTAEDLAVINEGKWTVLNRDGDLFFGELILSEGVAKIAAKFPNETSYKVLLEYAVI